MTAPSEYGSTLMSQSHKSQSPNRKVRQAFYALRESARKNGLQDMTLEEINEEIRQARLEKEERE